MSADTNDDDDNNETVKRRTENISFETLINKKLRCRKKQHQLFQQLPKNAVWSNFHNVYVLHQQHQHKCKCQQPRIRKTLYTQNQTTVSYITKLKQKRRKQVTTTVLNTITTQLWQTEDTSGMADASTQTDRVRSDDNDRDDDDPYDFYNPNSIHNIIHEFIASLIRILLAIILIEFVLNIWCKRLNINSGSFVFPFRRQSQEWRLHNSTPIFFSFFNNNSRKHQHHHHIVTTTNDNLNSSLCQDIRLLIRTSHPSHSSNISSFHIESWRNNEKLHSSFFFDPPQEIKTFPKMYNTLKSSSVLNQATTTSSEISFLL